MTIKVVKGSLWTLAGQVAPLMVSLITTPISIRLLGAESYGVLILVGLIPTYFAFADLGMGLAATKFGSQAFSNSDLIGENKVIWTATVWGLIGSLPVASLLILLSTRTVDVLNIPSHLAMEAAVAIRIASVTFVISAVNAILSASQYARLRMDIVTLLNTVPRILGLVGTPLVLYFGLGIVGVTIILLVASLMTLTGNLLFLRIFLKQNFTPSFDKKVARSMIRFGLMVAVAGIATAIITNIEKLAIPSLTSVEQLAYYSVAFTIAFMMTLFSVSMAQSLIPAFSQLQGRSDRSLLSSLYNRAIKLNLIWISPLLTVLAIFGDVLIGLWAGADFGENGATAFRILLLGVGAHVISTPARAALMASGRSDIMAKVAWAELLPYILVVAGSTYQYGAAGAASAWSLRTIIDAVLSFIIVGKINELSLSGFFSFKYLTLFVCILPVLGASIFGATSIVTVLTLGVFMILYVVLVWFYVLDKQESAWLIKSFKLKLLGF